MMKYKTPNQTHVYLLDFILIHAITRKITSMINDKIIFLLFEKLTIFIIEYKFRGKII